MLSSAHAVSLSPSCCVEISEVGGAVLPMRRLFIQARWFRVAIDPPAGPFYYSWTVPFVPAGETQNYAAFDFPGIGSWVRAFLCHCSVALLRGESDPRLTSFGTCLCAFARCVT